MDKDEEIVIIENLPPGHYLELPLENKDISEKKDECNGRMILFDNVS